MAKWGEGDPRWIVEERADAVNVNNWHWTEKDASSWSKEKFKELFKGLEIATDKATFKISDITKSEGEACANNRKAKLIFFYEWVIELEWTGSLADSENVLRGKIEIPNLSEENEVHEIDVNVSANKRSEESEKLLVVFKTEGVTKIREQLGKYINQLKNDFIQGMILPSKDKQMQNAKSEKDTKEAFKNITISSTKKESKDNGTKPLGVPISTRKIVMKEEFLMSAEDLYNTLTEEQRLSAFTRCPAKVDATKGGTFVLLDGNVSGKFVDLVRDQKIVMNWRLRSWPDEHYSSVTITLTEKGDRTELALTQTGVPEAKYDETLAGWRQYYWEAIKRTFSCGFRYF
ncbi:activator of 90 kDa heat shock protein ATPase homolog 1-like [Actinia tenebrosa]|uniref:Activator of 90 kDa heat shock protein ATPase homolog 1-like n=1 Tax=Actinia tenebrosa TaxID=6105 RepID=A0A6P8ITI6_ACTTE|nr:activator of 90 kDa heat shock protein ATPase homolog 1-like [Actinia tenebrosa]